jgi:hypothetical protein
MRKESSPGFGLAGPMARREDPALISPKRGGVYFETSTGVMNLYHDELESNLKPEAA